MYIVGALVVFVYGWKFVIREIGRLDTFDTVTMITVVCSKTLYDEEWEKGYRPEEQAITMFPGKLKTSGGRILDGWGHPIIISVQNMAECFSITITSAGPDGRIGTEDDIIRHQYLRHDGKLYRPSYGETP